jgi:hypothetical protein
MTEPTTLDRNADWKALQAWLVEQGLDPVADPRQADLPLTPWSDGYGLRLKRERKTPRSKFWTWRVTVLTGHRDTVVARKDFWEHSEAQALGDRLRAVLFDNQGGASMSELQHPVRVSYTRDLHHIDMDFTPTGWGVAACTLHLSYAGGRVTASMLSTRAMGLPPREIAGMAAAITLAAQVSAVIHYDQDVSEAMNAAHDVFSAQGVTA